MRKNNKTVSKMKTTNRPFNNNMFLFKINTNFVTNIAKAFSTRIHAFIN